MRTVQGAPVVPSEGLGVGRGWAEPCRVACSAGGRPVYVLGKSDGPRLEACSLEL